MMKGRRGQMMIVTPERPITILRIAFTCSPGKRAEVSNYLQKKGQIGLSREGK